MPLEILQLLRRGLERMVGRSMLKRRRMRPPLVERWLGWRKRVVRMRMRLIEMSCWILKVRERGARLSHALLLRYLHGMLWVVLS